VIDTHAHLDALDDPSAVLTRARGAGVSRVLTVGMEQAVELAARFEDVYAVVGVHPHETGEAGPDAVDEARRLMNDSKAVAVGEIGLDYYRDYAPRDAQRRMFDAQLALAADIGAPVVIHTRSAEGDTLAALAGFEGTVILHCFSSPGLLPAALEHGWYVSFAGNVTFPRAEDLRAAAVQVPDTRLLAETDSPYLSPQPLRGRPNEPANVVHTLETLAAVREVAPEELAARIDANADEAFSLP
jgi:TatD DNase family protein